VPELVAGRAEQAEHVASPGQGEVLFEPDGALHALVAGAEGVFLDFGASGGCEDAVGPAVFAVADGLEGAVDLAGALGAQEAAVGVVLVGDVGSSDAEREEGAAGGEGDEEGVDEEVVASHPPHASMGRVSREHWQIGSPRMKPAPQQGPSWRSWSHSGQGRRRTGQSGPQSQREPGAAPGPWQ